MYNPDKKVRNIRCNKWYDGKKIDTKWYYINCYMNYWMNNSSQLYSSKYHITWHLIVKWCQSDF